MTTMFIISLITALIALVVGTSSLVIASRAEGAREKRALGICGGAIIVICVSTLCAIYSAYSGAVDTALAGIPFPACEYATVIFLFGAPGEKITSAIRNKFLAFLLYLVDSGIRFDNLEKRYGLVKDGKDKMPVMRLPILEGSMLAACRIAEEYCRQFNCPEYVYKYSDSVYVHTAIKEGAPVSTSFESVEYDGTGLQIWLNGENTPLNLEHTPRTEEIVMLDVFAGYYFSGESGASEEEIKAVESYLEGYAVLDAEEEGFFGTCEVTGARGTCLTYSVRAI